MISNADALCINLRKQNDFWLTSDQSILMALGTICGPNRNKNCGRSTRIHLERTEAWHPCQISCSICRRKLLKLSKVNVVYKTRQDSCALGHNTYTKIKATTYSFLSSFQVHSICMYYTNAASRQFKCAFRPGAHHNNGTCSKRGTREKKTVGTSAKQQRKRFPTRQRRGQTCQSRDCVGALEKPAGAWGYSVLSAAPQTFPLWSDAEPPTEPGAAKVEGGRLEKM